MNKILTLIITISIFIIYYQVNNPQVTKKTLECAKQATKLKAFETMECK